MRDACLYIDYDVAEIISKRLVENHPNKELVGRFADNISCSLAELSDRVIRPMSWPYLEASLDEVKESYEIFENSSELICGKCHTSMRYPSYLSFDVLIDPANGNTIASKDYESVRIIPR